MNGPGREREDLAAFLLRLRSRQIGDQALGEAVEAVPRRLFVPHDLADAYGDRSLPIDCGQTMPGAFFAVRLVHLLRPARNQNILEVGTGSGYVTALLARLARRVTSLERYSRLLAAAEKRLKLLKIDNVHLIKEDGRNGYVAAGPYERIIVHASFEEKPRQFLDQLTPQGALICAIGAGNEAQALVRLTKVGSRFEREDVGSARYQPIGFGTSAVL